MLDGTGTFSVWETTDFSLRTDLNISANVVAKFTHHAYRGYFCTQLEFC